MKKIIVLLLATGMAYHAWSQPLHTANNLPAYRNTTLPVEKRVADLLSRMTLEEKVAQLRSMIAARPRLTDVVLNNAAKMDSLFKNGIGMMNPDFEATPAQTVSRRNALQNYLKQKTRLGIPVIYLDEAHHGLLAPNADVFPHSIGLACSWDTLLIQKVYDYVGRESYFKGTNCVLAPIVDVTRDPRWGRTGETFGEDPYLCGVLASAVVRGFQGSSDGHVAPFHVAATLKTFTGHGQPEGGINQGPANLSVRTLREMHMESFRIAINRSQPAALMASYDEVDDIPSHANKWLLTAVLRKEWGFKGVVVSDWYGIDQLWKKHLVAADQKEAALHAFDAGVTIDLPYGVNYNRLTELVNEKKINMADLDKQVSYILTMKFKMGLFEAGDADIEKAQQLSASGEGRKLALEAAEKSMVLLKNEGGLLPIKKDQFKKIAVIGPCAAVNYTGDYSGIPAHNVSVLEGIRNKVAGVAEVLYAKGVALTKNGDTLSYNNYNIVNKPIFPDPEENRRLITEAVNTARQTDFIVVAIGENEQFNREGQPGEHWGDMSDLGLQSQQEELVQALKALDKPMVVYLAHGKPLAINWVATHVPAIVDGWYTGEECGNAFANILFGDVNPSGKLTISIPRSAGQVPVYYNHKPSAQFYEYVTEKNTPLYAFGYGLSYTTFRYAAPVLSAATINKTGSVTVTLNVTNTGNRKGDEIVQLYIHQKVSSAVRPVKELKDFARVSLAAGETKTVTFTLPATKLAYWNADMKYITEPGVFEIMTGSSSTDVQKVDLLVQ